MSETYRVVEIFDSIDGEGKTAGELATFVRFAGCNLRCSYCDTAYALSFKDGKDMTGDEIVARMDAIGNMNVTLTGGEPLLQKNVNSLISDLLEHGHRVNIETNGSVDIAPFAVDERVTVTMDYKTRSAGVGEQARAVKNIPMLRRTDVLKIVLQESDLQEVEQVLLETRPECLVYLSPIYGAIEPFRLVEFMKMIRQKGMKTENVRVQVQLHKVIWPAEMRGV